MSNVLDLEIMRLKRALDNVCKQPPSRRGDGYYDHVERDRYEPSPLQEKVATVLNMLLRLMENGVDPESFFLMYGSTDPDSSPQRAVSYLTLELDEQDLRAAMEKVYADMRKSKTPNST